MILDAHHHLWRYTQADYGWIDDGMQRIARDFEVADLSQAGGGRVQGSVAVQARQTVEETDWLLETAEQSDYVRAVVGWAPLAEDSLSQHLDAWADRKLLKGLRHVVQDEPDDGFLDREPFNRGVAEALSRGYRYDLLIFARQFPQTIRFVDRHPSGSFVLDHIGKPAIAEGEHGVWASQIKQLAERENVACKLSGVVTEADWASWTPESIKPYLDTALEAFGPGRLMFGTDWPVCLLATEYERWLDVVTDWAAPLSDNERDALFCRTAAEFYGIPIEA